MLANELHLVDFARNERVYRLTSQQGNTSVRTFLGSLPGLPHSVTIRQNPGTGPSAIDRHNIVLERQKMDASNTMKRKAVISITVSHPQDGTFTTSDLKSMLSEAIYLTIRDHVDLEAAPGSFTFSDSLEAGNVYESLVFGET